MPLAYQFLEQIYKQTDEWGKQVASELKAKTNYKPELFEVRVIKSEAYVLANYLKEGNSINLGLLARSLEDRTKRAKIMFLMVKNRKEEITLLPDDNYDVKVSDRLLIAATKEAKDDFLTVINNYNEFFYITTGKEYKFGIFKKLLRE
jgi:hypothetical protein